MACDFHPVLCIHSAHTFRCSAARLTKRLRKGEYVQPVVKQLLDAVSLPRFLKSALAYYARNYEGDELKATLIERSHSSTAGEIWELVAERNEYRAEWAKRWEEEELDFVITVPTAMPALKEGTNDKATSMMASYCFLFSIVRCYFVPFSCSS